MPPADAFGKPTLPSEPAPPRPPRTRRRPTPRLRRQRGCRLQARPFLRRNSHRGGVRAEFTHQIFRDDETIFGYRDLRVVIHMQAHLFKSYVHISYAEKIKSALNPADDILGMLKKHLGDDVTTDPAVFDAWLVADADRPSPGGRDGHLVGGPAGTVETARVFRLSDAAVYPWHARFEPFTLFYIDGASAIDSEDERWTLLTVTCASPDGSDWRLLSFATVYEFYQYPDSTRARLSQIVVLPPYQRRGLGGKMLEAVRARAAAKNFAESPWRIPPRSCSASAMLGRARADAATERDGGGAPMRDGGGGAEGR